MKIRGHMPALDGLRGVAILLVLMHAFDVVHAEHGAGHLVDLALDVGWIGVQLFFVLSGFLITGILLDTRDRPRYFKNFYIRRALRIFPLYYACVAFGNIWYWVYLQNFGHLDPRLPHFWSLAVEEQFYLVWPALVWVAGRRGVIALAGVLVAAAIVSRQLVPHDAAYTWTPCRMDALAIGAALAAAVRGAWLPARLERLGANAVVVAGGALVLGGVVLGRFLREGPMMQLAGYTIIALGFAFVLIAVVMDGLPGRLMSSAPLRRVGMYSYGMYVFHAPLHVYVGLPLLARLGPSPGIAYALAYVVGASLVTFAAAAVSYHLYERRFLALKPRLAP